MVTSSSHSIIITQGTSSDERTPEAVAVVITKAGGAGDESAPRFVSSSAFESETNLSVNYLDSIANVVTHHCPAWFVVGNCSNGHRFAKELHCGREWCPVCGKRHSVAHNRRIARWLPKAMQLSRMGYLVFTIPEYARCFYRNKEALSRVTKLVTAGDKSMRLPGLLKNLGYTRGLVRWHWFGDESNKYHPHLNVIIEAGYLTRAQIAAITQGWEDILGVSNAVVNYSYTAKVPKMLHIIEYITRATFLDIAWDEYLAGSLYNFRNMRSWGNWDSEPAWHCEGKTELQPVTDLEAGVCPVCGEPVTWKGRALRIEYLPDMVTKEFGSGYYQLIDTSGGLDKHSNKCYCKY